MCESQSANICQRLDSVDIARKNTFVLACMFIIYSADVLDSRTSDTCTQVNDSKEKRDLWGYLQYMYRLYFLLSF